MTWESPPTTNQPFRISWVRWVKKLFNLIILSIEHEKLNQPKVLDTSTALILELFRLITS